MNTIPIKTKYFLNNSIRLRKKVYIYEEIKIGFIRISYYRLGKKFTIRFEINYGWQ